MAYNTRPLKRAQDGVAPQYYNRTVDEYEVLEGTAGANHVVIYGPDGQPASLATEAKLEAARALLESLDGKDFASETTLAAMETELGLAKTELAAIKEMLTDGTAKGEVTLSGTFAEDILSKMDLANSLLALISHGQTKAVLNSWQQVQHIVRAGLHHQVFQIGDQFVATFDGQPVVWDVIGIDHDKPTDPRFTHSLTIQSHDCLLNAQFSAPQALFYTEPGLAAGTYNFAHGGTSYQFTLTQPVPAGGQLTFPWAYDTDILTTKVSSFPSRTSTTAIETVGISVGIGGSTLSPINDISRCRYGSNNYLESSIREWLNSDSASHAWTPQTIYDRPSTGAPYSGAGFLNRLDPELVAVLGAVDKQVARNTVTDGGGQDLFSDKVFLLSRVEVYGGNEGVVTGEKPYDYYASMASSPTTAALDGRIKLLGSSARTWWLRSPNPGHSHGPRRVLTDGQVYHHGASNANGAAPACCIV